MCFRLRPGAAVAALAPLLLLPLLACSDATHPRPTARIRVADGDRQVGFVGRRLPRPLEVLAVDDAGAPASGVTVRWRPELNGTVDRASAVTDAAGRATAWFTVGPDPGTAAATAWTDADSAPFVFEARLPQPGELPEGEIRTLQLATFDGSGQTVHPDHVEHGAAFTFSRHLAVTPYPNGNAAYELPSLFGGNGVVRWQLEPGAPNPVVPAPPTGHMSDPDIVFEPERRELWMYYRHVDQGRNIILLVRSADGRTWSSPVVVMSAPSHEIVSPTVVRRGPGDWLMWYVDSGEKGCGAASTTVKLRRSGDGLQWGPPQSLAMSHDGMHPWHIDVQWIAERGEYWALYNSKWPGSCATPAVFLATSRDGVSWTHLPEPLLKKGDHPDLGHIVYRGTFRYDAARAIVTFWYSGAAHREGRYVWSSAVQELSLGAVLDHARGAAPRLELLEPPPGELTDWP